MKSHENPSGSKPNVIGVILFTKKIGENYKRIHFTFYMEYICNLKALLGLFEIRDI